jgi:hypothetical protein
VAKVSRSEVAGDERNEVKMKKKKKKQKVIIQ